MVTVIFYRSGAELLRLGISYNQPVSIVGDASWIDFTSALVSPRTGTLVSLATDAEEWARALALAYQATGLGVSLSEAPALMSVTALVDHSGGVRAAPVAPWPQTAFDIPLPTAAWRVIGAILVALILVFAGLAVASGEHLKTQVPAPAPNIVQR
jgi:hypothetical protein